MRWLTSALPALPRSSSTAWALLMCGLLPAAMLQLALGVGGVSIAAGVLSLGVALEFTSGISQRRQQRLAKLWPQVFDSFYSAQAAGIELTEQLAELSKHGPLPLRRAFGRLSDDLVKLPLADALERFSAGLGSREADLLVTLITLSSELGAIGQRNAWRTASEHLRQSLRLHGEVVAKQSWVVGSAKVALLAPWAIALLLIQLPGNRAAFATDAGTLVLLGGLMLSLLGYFLVSTMGRLPIQPRVFYAHGTQ
jgi:tight adherence protein B